MSSATIDRPLDRVQSLTLRVQDLQEQQRALTAELEAAHRQLGQAQEEVAFEQALPGSEFATQWSRLLDSVQAHRNPQHYDELYAALGALKHGRSPMLMTAGTIRQDNRQVVLTVLVPSEAEALERLYLFLLALSPVLVNAHNPDPTRRAAVLNVMSRSISDKESLSLLVDPAQGRYEVVRAYRGVDEVPFTFDTLREALHYLSVHHAYH